MGRLMAMVLLVAGAGIAVIATNGPGKDKPEETDKLTPRNQSAHVSLPPADGPVGATIIMRRLAFSPTSATLRTGQSVRFVNKDEVTHTVIQDFGPRSGVIAQFDTQRILPGQAFVFTARVAGTIDFVCTLHPTVMSGRLIVTGANA